MDEGGTPPLQAFSFYQTNVTTSVLQSGPITNIQDCHIENIDAKAQPCANSQRSVSSTVHNSIMLDRARMMMRDSEHARALQILEGHPDKDAFTSKLLLAECYLGTNDHEKANDAITDVKSLLATSPCISVTDVMNYALELRKKSYWVRSIVLIRIAADKYNTEGAQPDDVVNNLQSCVNVSSIAVEQLLKAGGVMKNIGINHGIRYMSEMLKSVEDVKNADQANKALKLAWCCGYLGYCHILADQHKKSMEVRSEGVDILEKQFGVDAVKYLIYGYMLHNLGVSYHHMGKYSEAESYYIKAILARKMTEDYASDEEKNTYVKTTRDDYRKTLDYLE